MESDPSISPLLDGDHMEGRLQLKSNHYVIVKDRQFIWCKNTVFYFLLRNKKNSYVIEAVRYIHKYRLKGNNTKC